MYDQMWHLALAPLSSDSWFTQTLTGGTHMAVLSQTNDHSEIADPHYNNSLRWFNLDNQVFAFHCCSDSQHSNTPCNICTAVDLHRESHHAEGMSAKAVHKIQRSQKLPQKCNNNQKETKIPQKKELTKVQPHTTIKLKNKRHWWHLKPQMSNIMNQNGPDLW